VAAFAEAAKGFTSADDTLDFLYGVYGTGLESVDVASAALCIFLYAPLDSWMALRMGASVGGDTDTIAALAGCLAAAHRAASGLEGGLPSGLLAYVLSTNGIELESLVARLLSGAAG
jgi:ADP-ribosylglycohydrolase